MMYCMIEMYDDGHCLPHYHQTTVRVVLAWCWSVRGWGTVGCPVTDGLLMIGHDGRCSLELETLETNLREV